MKHEESRREQSPSNPQPKNEKQCRYCRQEIRSDASVCQHCQRHQRRLWQYIQSYAILPTSIMVLVSVYQLWEAHKARITAEDVKCDLLEVGFDLIDIGNNIYYSLYRVPATTEEEREEMFGRIAALKKRLKKEYSRSNCRYFPVMDYPTKTFGLSSPP